MITVKNCKNWIILYRDQMPVYGLSNKSLKSFTEGLKFYTPFSLTKKIVIKLFPFIFSFGKYFFVTGKLPVEIEKVIWILKKEGINCNLFNFYYPASGRIIIQCLDNKEVTEGYIKIFLDKSDFINIVNEYKALEYLNSVNFNKFSIPAILLNTKENNYSLLYTSSPKKIKKITDISLNLNIVNISSELFLSNSTVKKFKELDVYNLLLEYKDKIDNKDIGELIEKQMLSFKDLSIPVGVVHGDFKPWNLLIDKDNNSYFLFDWEDMRNEGFPLHDLFTYSIITAIVLNNNISGKELFRVFTSNIKHYKEFLRKIGVVDDKKYLIFFLLLFVFNFMNNENFWKRKDKEHSGKTKEILENFMYYLLENN